MAEGGSLAEDRKRGAELIEGVLAGRLTPEDALEQWPEPINSPAQTLTTAWTSLGHFGDDADIHVKDPGYEEAEREKLRKVAARLRAEVVEFGDEPSEDTSTPLSHIRIANTVLATLGYLMGYVLLMGIIIPLGDIGVAALLQLLGLAGLVICVLLALLGCCTKRPFLFGAMLGLGIHAAWIAWMWHGKPSN